MRGGDITMKSIDEIKTVEELRALQKQMEDRLDEIRQHEKEEAENVKGIMNWFLRFVNSLR